MAASSVEELRAGMASERDGADEEADGGLTLCLVSYTLVFLYSSIAKLQNTPNSTHVATLTLTLHLT